jgi:hypothetical protein
MAKHEDYCAARRRRWSCDCGWRGSIDDLSLVPYTGVLEGSCPACGRHLILSSYPTDEETRAAAATGDGIAIGNLAHRERAHERAGRAATLELERPDQLPSLRLAGPTRFVWDQVSELPCVSDRLELAGKRPRPRRQVVTREGFEQLGHSRDRLRWRELRFDFSHSSSLAVAAEEALPTCVNPYEFALRSPVFSCQTTASDSRTTPIE